MCDTLKLSVYVATYLTSDDALDGYEAVKALYYDADMMDTFDASVLEKDIDGKVKILAKHEQPTRQVGWAGAGIGMSVALLTALFPAVALSGSLLLGGAATGGALGAMMGHAGAGMSRSDLKDLGELLDCSEYGLIVVAVTDMSARIDAVLSSADKVVTKELNADQKELEKEIKKELEE